MMSTCTARLAGDVADDVVELHVHLGQMFAVLHVLDMLGRDGYSTSTATWARCWAQSIAAQAGHGRRKRTRAFVRPRRARAMTEGSRQQIP